MIDFICNILIFLSVWDSCKNSEKNILEKKTKEQRFILEKKIETKKIDEEKRIAKIEEERLAEEKRIEKEKKKLHIETPEYVQSLYYTAYAIGNEERYDNLLKISKNTEINSVIIDIKTVSWYTSFNFDNSRFWKIKSVSDNRIKNIKEIIKDLHLENIYVVWRIVVFKDNLLTKNRPDLAYKWSWNKNKTWWDYSGNKYLDANSKEVWDYNFNIASEAYKIGFDEINFDYIRFPSDWKIHQIYAPFSDEVLKKDKINWKIKIINNFSKYITTKLKKKHPKIVLSADVFWLVTNWNLNTIWQSLEWFLKHFDFVAPMTYPSHYWKWFLGFANPDNHPYEIITDALKNAYSKIDKYNLDKNNIKKLEKKQIRLWLQWFSCTRCKGSTPYMDNKFKLQTKAITDNNSSWFWVWNANSNYYESWYKPHLTSPKGEE